MRAKGGEFPTLLREKRRLITKRGSLRQKDLVLMWSVRDIMSFPREVW